MAPVILLHSTIYKLLVTKYSPATLRYRVITYRQHIWDHRWGWLWPGNRWCRKRPINASPRVHARQRVRLPRCLHETHKERFLYIFSWCRIHVSWCRIVYNVTKTLTHCLVRAIAAEHEEWPSTATDDADGSDQLERLLDKDTTWCFPVRGVIT